VKKGWGGIKTVSATVRSIDGGIVATQNTRKKEAANRTAPWRLPSREEDSFAQPLRAMHSLLAYSMCLNLPQAASQRHTVWSDELEIGTRASKDLCQEREITIHLYVCTLHPSSRQLIRHTQHLQSSYCLVIQRGYYIMTHLPPINRNH
jgi:hypothetical protein